jgi:hypothetical protein
MAGFGIATRGGTANGHELLQACRLIQPRMSTPGPSVLTTGLGVIGVRRGVTAGSRPSCHSCHSIAVAAKTGKNGSAPAILRGDLEDPATGLLLFALAHPWGQSGDSECRDRSQSAGRQRRPHARRPRHPAAIYESAYWSTSKFAPIFASNPIKVSVNTNPGPVGSLGETYRTTLRMIREPS